MKALRKIGMLAVLAVAVIGITGCRVQTESDIDEAPEVFRKIPGVSITGTESWVPTSKVFVSGRALEIKPFYMSEQEVTRARYKKVMGSDPSKAKAHDKDGNELPGNAVGNNPVNSVNWYDALVYCNKRSIKEKLTPCYKINGSTNPDDWGTPPTKDDKDDSDNNKKWNAAECDFTANGYRLPTEAEWEWAARGGKNYTYAGSDDVNEVAWYEANTKKKGTMEAKTKKANGYELYDMSGNVWEWCWDWYSASVSATTPASGSPSGDKRCLRGGSWYNAEKDVHVERRGYNLPKFPLANFGFRVVRNAN